MESPVATVVAVEQGSALLRVERNVACARCASGKGCGAGFLADSAASVELRLQVPEGITLRPGDTVNLTMEPANIFSAAVYVYGLPLLGVVGALIIGRILLGPMSDGVAVATALFGLLAGFTSGRHILRRQRCIEQFTPGIAGRSKHGAQHG